MEHTAEDQPGEPAEPHEAERVLARAQTPAQRVQAAHPAAHLQELYVLAAGGGGEGHDHNSHAAAQKQPQEVQRRPEGHKPRRGREQ